MDNQKIATVFGEIGDMLDIQGADFFRVNAYRRSAQVIEHLPHDLHDSYLRTGELEKIPGIGVELTKKIIELITRGRCEFHEELVASFPKGLLEMLHLRSVGPKKVKLFFGTLGISNLDQLKKAAATGQLRDLPKMGEKSESEILKAIEEYEQMPHGRRLLHVGMTEAQKILEYLRGCPEISLIQYAGSLRRGVETIGDVDILCAPKKMSDAAVGNIMDFYAKYDEISMIMNRGETKSSVLLKTGLQVDLRVLESKIFGAALHYFTGSKAHNIRIRDRAKHMGLKVSEYGVFKVAGEEETLVAGATEEEIFHSVGLPYIIPEMREDRGEIEYGLQFGTMPSVVEHDDLRADLHTHSRWSDGSEEIEDLAKAYKKAGFSHMALTDHSKLMGVTAGLTDERATEQWEEIDEINKELAPFRILKGSEVDILKDGSLDFSEKILKKLEVVNASAHLYHGLPEDEQTRRMLSAVTSGYVKILSHPTGRLINERKPIAFDMEAVFKACADHHVALEINSSPDRMDLNDTHVRLAKSLGCTFAINSDAHNSSHMHYLTYGVLTARRAWLTKEDIINTMSLKELLKYWKLK